MKKAFAWVAGILIAVLGGFIVVEGALPPKSFPIIIAGVIVVLLGGFILPSDAISSGSQKLLVVAQPYIPAAFGGGRRVTDTHPCPPKDGAK